MVGAHNGNVVNNVELRQQFMAEGMTVRSENDGETCVHAVERYINRGYEFVDAIRLAYGDLQGDYAFVIGRADDDKLYAFKKGSGLVVGLGDGFTCVSSDLPSILPLTRDVIRPHDGEIVTLWADQVEVRSVEGRQPHRPRARDGHRDHGRGAEGRLPALHAEGDPRAAAGRPRAAAPAGRKPGRRDAGGEDEEARGTCTSSPAARAITRPGGLGLLRAAGGPPPSRCWRRSSSRSTHPRSATRMWASSSASRARPRMC